MKFIKIRKPLKNLNEVLKHTEMPQKFYGNASKKKETPQQNKVLKFSQKTETPQQNLVLKLFSKNGNASKKNRKRLKKKEETPQLNQVLKNTEKPQKFWGNASEKEETP